MEEIYKKYFGSEWYGELKDVLHSEYFTNLRLFLKQEKESKIIYPVKMELAFRAFRETPYNKVKVVIIGQDIYHDNSFDGLAFSNGTKSSGFSPSLINIMKEVKSDVNGEVKYDLTDWAKQGVFLINTGLTVIKGKPGSHTDKWKPFMYQVIKSLRKRENLVYLLWGIFAQNFKQFMDDEHNLILCSGHPSPLNTSRPFKGNKHFSKINIYLEEHNIEKINW